MNLSNKYRINTDINVYFVNLAETKFERKELLSGLRVFIDFMSKFHCTIDELCEAIDKCLIEDKHLFEYTISYTPFLVEENAVYIIKQVSWGTQRFYYSLYLTSYQYVSLYLNKVAEYIVKKHYPFLFEKPFTKVEKRFKDSINKLPKNVSALVDDIDATCLMDNELKIIDLINLYTDKTYKDSCVEKPLIKIYSDNTYIYLNLGREHETLYFTIDAIENKDWKEIENIKVHSIPLYDEKGNIIPKKWFEGKQKDAPYFKNELVKTLKKMILEK